jgi:hypothetical protein
LKVFNKAQIILKVLKATQTFQKSNLTKSFINISQYLKLSTFKYLISKIHPKKSLYYHSSIIISIIRNNKLVNNVDTQRSEVTSINNTSCWVKAALSAHRNKNSSKKGYPISNGRSTKSVMKRSLLNK